MSLAKAFIHSIKTAFNKARDRAGLGPEVSPYTLRHTGATLLAAKGVPMRQVAGMLGHTDSKTTERHYAKHSPEFLGEAAAVLDDLYRPPLLLAGPAPRG